MPDKNSDISERKKEDISTISQIDEADFNRLLDAVILIANAAKRKTSLRQIGLKAIMNEKEPETEDRTGSEPMHYPDSDPGEEKKDVG